MTSPYSSISICTGPKQEEDMGDKSPKNKEKKKEKKKNKKEKKE
jgi:hypothetical protein